MINSYLSGHENTLSNLASLCRLIRPEFFIEKLERLVWPNIRILSFDESSAKVYGRLRADMERKGTPLTEPDLRIASIAMHHGLSVITGNSKHFSRVPGLEVEDWIHP